METLENKGIYTSLENKIKIRKLEDDFLSEFWKFISNTGIKASLKCAELREQLKERYSEDALPCVSLDPIYASNNSFLYLSVTRITNQFTGSKKIGPRPGKKSIEDQINDIGECYSKIKLIDCGAFEGDTLLEIIELLEKQKVSVEKVYLAVSSYLAMDKITQKCKVITNNAFNFYEWIELRDLFGIDGRKVSEIENAFIPYWENLEEWASIPQENARTVEELCKKYNSSLINMLRTTKCDIDKIGKIVSYERRIEK